MKNLFVSARSAALEFTLPLLLLPFPAILLYFVLAAKLVSVSIAKPSMTRASLPSKELPSKVIASKGRQPKALLTLDGRLNLVFGWENTVYYKKTTLSPNPPSRPNSIVSGTSVSDTSGDRSHLDTTDLETTDSDSAVAVATLPEGLMLGMGRGPQIAVWEKKLVIAAADKKGNLYSWHQDQTSDKWLGPFRINDRDGVAQEGFIALLAGKKGRFYAFWNDLRSGDNQIYGAISLDQGLSWQKSQLIYASSDTTICECCKVSAAADQKGNVYLMWRNQLNGYRDMYLLTLDQNLKSKTIAAKLGKGSWQLNGCPMDGGNLTVSPSGKVLTVWRRESNLYSCQPGRTEMLLAQGRNPVVAATDQRTALAWDSGQQVFYQVQEEGNSRPENQTNPIKIGNGTYPSLATNGKQIVLCWESVSGQILFHLLPANNLVSSKNQLH